MLPFYSFWGIMIWCYYGRREAKVIMSRGEEVTTGAAKREAGVK